MLRPRHLLYVSLVVLAIFSLPTHAQTLSPLHAQGRVIRDTKGKIVQLRGVNVGGWLVTESWMCGQIDDGGRKAREQLEARFGAEKAAVLMKAWEDNWFTSADLDLIRGYGCNVLRVPFSYRTLQDATGIWRRDAKRNIDFSRMDWIVKEAQARGMYVVFVLHTWPGDYHDISRNTPEGKVARGKMSLLWSEVARHYRGVGAIAAFDAINEPEGSPGNILQKAFYDAVRAQDGQRMLAFESLAYPSIRSERWTNIVWSAHYPERSRGDGSVRERLDEFDRKEKISATPAVQVPIFIGELKAPQDTAESASDMAAALNERGWSWAVWTYKGVDNGGWASVNYDRALKYNLADDSYESILDKWTTGLSQWRDGSQPANLHKNEWWIRGFGSGFTSGTAP